MIYKQPSIYKNGLTIKDIEKINKWEEITNKLGQNSTVPTTCFFRISINRFFKLLNVRSYGGFSDTSTIDRPIFNYNNDIPNVLNFDCISRSGGSSGTTTLLTSDSTNKMVFIYSTGVAYIDWAIQSSFVLIDNYKFDTLLAYIDSQ